MPRQPDGSFFADSRRLGEACGVSHVAALGAVQRLAEKGFIRIIDRGSRDPDDKRAGQYAWIGPEREGVASDVLQAPIEKGI
jgi:hypothetical protein